MKRKWWIAGGALLLVALALPYFSASFARQTLQSSLEVTLSRKVRIQGKTRFRVLPTPAILADDVIIDEDPSFSLEPFAYVTELEVHPGFLALLSGRLEAKRIRLTEPSVNLMRRSSGWNIQSLVSGKLHPPEIEVRNGRLNFKKDNAKSPFYLTNALVDISAISAQGDVRVYFSAEPARTDRGAQGFGVFSLRGAVHIPPAGVPSLDFDVELEPSSIHAFNFFFGARGVNFAGKLSGRGSIKGPWDQSGIEASLQFEGLEPQGFLPFSGKSNTVALSGFLDIPGQRIALDTVGGDTLRVRMRARDFLQEPKGAFLLELRQIELAKLLELGREANTKLPEGLKGEGKFNGVIGYSWPSAQEVPAKGMVWFSDASIELPDQPSLQIPAASAVVEGSRWLLAPCEVRVGSSQSAVLRAEWDARNGELKMDVATQLLSVKGLKTGIGLLVQASGLPLLSRAQGGSWQGTLQYSRTEDADPGNWRGRLGVRNTSVELDGVAAPLEVSTASVQFDPNRIVVRRMRAAWDSVEVEGEVTYSPGNQRPVDLNLTVAEASTARLEALLQSAQRPPAGLLDKIRLRRASMPEWLRTRNVTGQIQFKTLQFAAGSFDPLILRFLWRGELLEANIERAEYSQLDQAETIQVKGKLSTRFWQPTAQYEWAGTITGWPGEKGRFDLEGTFRSNSLSGGWTENLEGEGVLSLPDSPKLIARQGRIVLDFGEGRRRPVPILPPYWPLSIPPEP